MPPTESVCLPQWTMFEVSRLTGPCTSNQLCPSVGGHLECGHAHSSRGKLGNPVIGSGSVSVNEYFLFHVVLPPLFDRKLSPATKPQNWTSTDPPPPVSAHV